jgi:hypothetical protein
LNTSSQFEVELQKKEENKTEKAFIPIGCAIMDKFTVS